MDLFPAGKRKLHLTLMAAGAGYLASITIQAVSMLGVVVNPIALAYFNKSTDLIIAFLIAEGAADIVSRVRAVPPAKGDTES